MVRRKNIRTRGKISLSRFFQKFQPGEKVAIVKEISMQPKFPQRIQGKTGIVKSKRGRSYVVLIKDGKKDKEFILQPIHLKKIK
ncbi:MAG: 50S ribosomal protein L21e [Nanoarchaeota archaeon]|nr:50S ribosomal protein L21e [Nanoarchaeota archaeon]